MQAPPRGAFWTGDVLVMLICTVQVTLALADAWTLNAALQGLGVVFAAWYAFAVAMGVLRLRGQNTGKEADA